MTYPIQPGPSFPASKMGERPNTLLQLETTTRTDVPLIVPA